ncbi:hypothetical protein HWV62_25424 [Athelia sp. TMB]|nr:hypothetical protein HWV62_25424 [Athelia sp. TMB]
MSQRIRQLEDALAIFQSGVSTATHPLLRDELLSIKLGPEARPPQETQSLEESTEDPVTDTIDAFGTLTIGDGGESSYFGRSGGSEAELSADVDSSDNDRATGRVMPEFTNILAAMFPMGLGPATDSKMFAQAHDMLLSYLPPTPRAWSLLESYMENASWVFQPLRREHLIEDILTPIYNAKKERENPIPGKERTVISPHKIAVLFLVFGLGANMDFTLPPNNTQGEEYHHYARAAMTLRSVFDAPTMETVQALLLMAHFRGSAGEQYTRDSTWALIGLGCKLAQGMGLHRDPGRWNMDDKTANCRRRLFWELYVTDLFIGLALGRPPCMDLAYADCAFPSDRSEADNKFWSWKYTFAKDVFDSVIKLTLAAKPPSYKTILELDRKVRENVLPETFNVMRTTQEDQLSIREYLQGGLLSQYRTVTMLYLHKSFFAQALLEHPENPLLSRYAPSFLAAASCASTIVKSSVIHYSKFPQFCLRSEFDSARARRYSLCPHQMVEDIILGSIVTRSPSSPMAPNAFLEMGIAVDLFVEGAEHSLRGRRAMAILVKLKEKASVLFNQFRSGARPSNAITNSQVFHQQGGAVDELSILGGQTRILFSKTVLHEAPYWDATSTIMHSNAPAPQSISPLNSGTVPDLTPSTSSHPPIEQEDTAMQDVHPSLVAYMTMLSSPTTSNDFPGYPDEASSLSLDQPITSGSEGFSPFTVPTPDFFHLQATEYLMQQEQTRTRMASPFYDPDLFGPFEKFYQEAATYPNADSAAMWQTTDLGVPQSLNDSSDERWMAFVTESAAPPTTLDAFNVMLEHAE